MCSRLFCDPSSDSIGLIADFFLYCLSRVCLILLTLFTGLFLLPVSLVLRMVLPFPLLLSVAVGSYLFFLKRKNKEKINNI